MNHRKSFNIKPLVQTIALSIASFGGMVQADDIEVYLTTPVTVSPNVLFILDESGSMGWGAEDWVEIPDTDPSQRMYQLRNSMRKLLEDESMDNVKAAILGYRANISLTVHSPFVKVGEGSNREYLLNNVIGDAHLGGDHPGSLIHHHLTPSAPALAKGMNWFRGLDSSQESPIEHWCEPNYMIFLTDGEPSANNMNSYGDVNNCDAYETGHGWINDPAGYEEDGGQCSHVIAEWGYRHHRPDSGSGEWTTWYDKASPDPTYFDSSNKHFRNIITHTIGFHADPGSPGEAYLLDIANRSEDLKHPTYNHSNNYGKDLPTYNPNDPYTGGRYISAGNEDELLTALKSFIDQANREIDYTYTAPTIPFNADNAAISGNEMYLPMFKPDATVFWKGNIKKYKVEYDQENDQLRVLAQGTNQSSVDGAFRFVSSADFWNDTGTSDGANTLAGGANSNMTPPRFLYTYLEGNEKDLTNAGNRVHPSNVNITKELLNVTDEDARNRLLNWTNWLEDDGTTARTGDNAPYMGAPLHTQPVTVRYKNQEDLVFINTTEGILHAFNGETGKEEWAYMPDELLKTIQIARNNNASDLPMYGLDGPITVYRTDTIYQDDNNDGLPDKDEDDQEIIKVPGKTFLIVGMRRGFAKGDISQHVNRNYYVLDITDRNKPKFAWEIKGGITSGFNRLGQTWSKPIFTKLEIEGEDAQDVLIFGGGYDPDQDADSVTTQLDDDMGNAIFIVNPKTGALIKEINSTDMDKGKMGNGIASDVLTVDINANGITDRIYAADVAGRIIRVDIPDKALSQLTGSNELKGSILANVGQGDKGDNKLQRFFNTPEVAFYKRGGNTFLALLIGSGKRPDPVDQSVNDRFYMIKDYNVWVAPSAYPEVVTEDDLYDSTPNFIQEGTDEQKADAATALESKSGWYIDLGVGEKVFSEARVYDYAVLFTAYKGQVTEPDVCTATAVEGESFLYILDMKHGGARFNNSGDIFQQGNTTDLQKEDRKVSLMIPGMPPSPTLMFPAEDDGEGPSGWVLALVGLQSPAKWPDKYHPISWEEVTRD
jgi:type IV pilus assembly protein PilY1